MTARTPSSTPCVRGGSPPRRGRAVVRRLLTRGLVEPQSTAPRRGRDRGGPRGRAVAAAVAASTRRPNAVPRSAATRAGWRARWATRRVEPCRIGDDRAHARSSRPPLVRRGTPRWSPSFACALPAARLIPRWSVVLPGCPCRDAGGLRRPIALYAPWHTRDRRTARAADTGTGGASAAGR